MGSLCLRQEEIGTKKCSQCQKRVASQSCRTFSECSHIICQVCLAQIGVSQTACPLSHKKPNAMVELGRQIYNSVRKNPQAFQLCSKKHKMIWKDEFQLCSQCSIHLHGFQCRLCNESICTLCSNVFDPNKLKCPNRHSLTWRSTNIPCLLCGVKKYGWSCRDCRWYSCSDCCSTIYNFNNCPNSHPLTWKNSKETCLLCKEKHKCFQCLVCPGAIFCLKCTNFQYNRSLCPNKHSTNMVKKHCCTKCDLQMPGMFCIQCNYHFCTKCDIEKYSTTFKNRNESYESIRIVVENPLLQFEEFEQKSSIEGMKKAAQKIKRIPTLSINIEEDNNKSTEQLSNSIKKQIENTPQNTQLYEKLAEAYKIQQNHIEQISAYQKAIEIEEEKENKNPQILFRIGKKALQRTIQLKFRRSSLIILERLLKFAETSEIQQVLDSVEMWKLNKVEQLILCKEMAEAREEFSKVISTLPDYDRIKTMLQQVQI